MNALPHDRTGTIYGELEIIEAAGAELIDRSGRRLLDLTSGFGVAALGYSCRPIIEAVHRQMTKCGHAIPSLIGYSGEGKAAELILRYVGMPDGAVILTTSGAEAVEVARKIAYLATGKPDVVVLAGAYHGQSFGTLSFTGQRALRAPFESTLGRPALVLPTPTIDKHHDNTPERTADNSARLLELWLESAEHGNSQIGAVLVEPMQNLAGYRFFGKRFGATISDLCRRNGILLIADEVFTGFGRAGDWTLSSSAGYTPDIVCVGKALTGCVPGGACVASRDLLKLLFPIGKPPLHAPTFYCAPVVNAAIEAAITCLSSMGLIERASLIGDRIVNGLQDLPKQHELIIEIRGHGAAIAIEFSDDHDRGRSSGDVVLDVVRSLLARDVLALNSGFPTGNVLSICPPLIISDSEIERAVDALKEAINETAGDMHHSGD